MSNWLCSRENEQGCEQDPARRFTFVEGEASVILAGYYKLAAARAGLELPIPGAGKSGAVTNHSGQARLVTWALIS